MSPKPTRVAAGGLVERRMNGGVRLAIVRRTRYGDWVLPKGKPDGDETLEETAVREVREETGCDARIVAGGRYSIEYFVGSALKIVTFFRMEYVIDGFAVDAGEIQDVAWVQPAEALARLTYETERSIVRQAFKST